MVCRLGPGLAWAVSGSANGYQLIVRQLLVPTARASDSCLTTPMLLMPPRCWARLDNSSILYTKAMSAAAAAKGQP